MNRSVVRSAFGRCRFEVNCASTSSSYPTSTPRHFFSTTTPWQADSEGDSQPKPTFQGIKRTKVSSAAAELGSLNRQSGASGARPRLDARSLRASPPGPSGVTQPKIINVRSLRPRGGAQSRGGAEGGPAFRKFTPGGQGTGTDGAAARVPGRFARGGTPGRGRGGRAGRGGKRDMKRNPRKKADFEDEKNYKLTFTKDQQEYLDREEQGVVTPYTPSATLDDLAGYMPALATDSSLAKVGTAMRSMRVLAGGKPYHADGYYNDPRDTLKRYLGEKKAVFFDDLKEKDWVEGFNPKLKAKIQGPDEKTKSAIVQSAIQGKYTAPKFTELKDTMATLARYHVKDYSYKPTDGEKFDAKVLSLLPKGKAAGGRQAKARA